MTDATNSTASQIADHVPIEEAALERQILKMHAGMTLTRGHHDSLVNGYVRDIEWNAFDYWHRIYVHHTYNDALQVFSGKHFSVNVTRWGRLPIFIQVANAWVKPGVFLQTMSILGIIYCHQIVRLTQQQKQVLIEVNWYTGSHWIFRWLHPFFNARLLKLQQVQDAEDAQMREQRFKLRELGFRFATDCPDFLNANQLTDNVIPPPATAPLRISLEHLAAGSIEKVEAGTLAFLVKRGENSVTLWPALCPHEGAPLGVQHMCDGTLQCPWHGRKFKGFELAGDGVAEWKFLDASIRLEGATLTVEPAAHPVTSA